MTSSNGNIFRITGHLCGEFTGHHKGQWREASMFSLICTWTNVWVNYREAGDLRRHRAHHDVIVMCQPKKGDVAYVICNLNRRRITLNITLKSMEHITAYKLSHDIPLDTSLFLSRTDWLRQTLKSYLNGSPWKDVAEFHMLKCFK